MFSQTTFIVVVWMSFLFAASSTIVRLTVQTSFISKPYDSALSHLALVVLLVNSITNTFLALASFQPSQGHANIRLTAPFFQLQFVCTVLSTTCLWLVKASFLASYYSLINSVIPLRRAWYMILGMATTAYVCCVVDYPFTSKSCISDCIALNFKLSPAMLCLSTAWDMVSNMCLVAFPLIILLKTHQSLQEKCVAAFQYSLIGIVVVLAIARVATSFSATGLYKVFGLHLWGAAQCGVSLFINNFSAIHSQHRKNKQSQSRRPVQDIRYTTSSSRLKALHDSLQQRIQSMDDDCLAHYREHPSVRLPPQSISYLETIPTDTSLGSPISFRASHKRSLQIVRAEPTISTFSWSSDESDSPQNIESY